MTKKIEQEKARELRLQGFRLEDIANELHVSKSSVSQWTQDLEYSENVKEVFEERKREARRLSNEAKRAITKGRLAHARYTAQELVSSVDLTPELSTILCSLIYWCEGTKHINTIQLLHSLTRIPI